MRSYLCTDNCIDPSWVGTDVRALVRDVLEKAGPAPESTPTRFVNIVPETETQSGGVTRDVVKGCPAPVLVMPDETPSHPYEPALESAMLAPKAEMTFFPWKDTKEKIPLAVRHVRTFLKANRPA